MRNNSNISFFCFFLGPPKNMRLSIILLTCVQFKIDLSHVCWGVFIVLTTKKSFCSWVPNWFLIMSLGLCSLFFKQKNVLFVGFKLVFNYVVGGVFIVVLINQNVVVFKIILTICFLPFLRVLCVFECSDQQWSLINYLIS